MKEIKILDASSSDGLQKGINEHLKRGWELYGNLVVVAIDYDGNNSREYLEFYQTMIKEF